jgi:hypothetical protein
MVAAQNAKKRKKSSVKPQTAAVASVAPGQALGYLLQETLLTHRLLSALPGDFLSLELLEDVAVHQAGAAQELIQSTSTAGNNPVADRDPKLWKTLYNWITTVRQLKLDPARVRFVLYVSSPVNGPLVDALHAASTPAAVHASLAAARNELWGPAPDFPKRATLSLPLAKFANTVLSTEDNILVPLIANFQLQCGSSSPHSDFLSTLAQQIILEETDIDAVAPQMLGWVKQKLEISLEKQQPAVISRDEFFLEMKAFIRTIAFRQILRSFASRPSGEETEKQKLRTYVRQLELIEFDETRILSAITDFLMSASERVEWATRGLVHPTSFDDLDASLRTVWSNHSLIAEAGFSADKPIPRGRSLYGNCMNHQAPVQGMTAPSYFLRGCFHRLADSKELGWHPDFEVLLTELKK